VTHAPEPSGFLPERAPASATWRWLLHDASGAETTLPSGPTPLFPSQSDAESWVGEQWRDLLEDGVEAVSLVDGDRTVYGPMALRPVGG
jgi:hypothetical protein